MLKKKESFSLKLLSFNIGTFHTSFNSQSLFHFKKYKKMLWISLFLSKNISNFVCPKLKLYNWYFHSGEKELRDSQICHVIVTCWRFRSKMHFCIFQMELHFGMVFCYQNCSDLLWEEIVLVIEQKFWNSRLKAENLQKLWDH